MNNLVSVNSFAYIQNPYRLTIGIFGVRLEGMLRDKLVHKVLRIPHALHVGVDRTGEDTEAPTIVLIHGLARTHKVWNLTLKDLPSSSRVIAVDLLGFGESPKPDWRSYNAEEQAISLHTTLRKCGVTGDIIIVGHSLGALVAIEYAKKYPARLKSLILCSTPLYKSEPRYVFNKFKLPDGETFYKSMLRNFREKPDFTKKLNYYARRAKFIDEDFVVDDKNMRSVVRSIEMAIENQSAFEWLIETKVPTSLVYGRLDPYVIKKYYKTLAKHNPNVAVYPIVAAHEINRSKPYADAVRSLLFVQNPEV